ncbi:MAG: DNA helicase RecQ [Clostridia bacterium]|nr:DNA helicase RecQ [Clostridia bacterium]
MNAGEALKYYFGYDSFREGQEDIIRALLRAQDVLAVMPTGSGKSLCYQIPAILLPGITVVISPLISLMQDQVKALNDTGIPAAYINSSLTQAQISKVYELLLEGKYRILYAAPERLETLRFTDLSARIAISAVAVDEAHCISQWGQDFRPSYLKIVDFIDSLPSRPVIGAFTATATPEVKADITRLLRLNAPLAVMTGYDRKNLYFRVEAAQDKYAFVKKYIADHPEDSGIIYCATRKRTDDVYERLMAEGIHAARYHAGMTASERRESQEIFILDMCPVIVASNAFGMGIDKSNVRFVIHYNMPQSMECYYQEAGRAGRDGEPAECILLYSAQDVIIQKYLLEQKDPADLSPQEISVIRSRDLERLRLMERYCQTSGCLRNAILSYFGEKREEPCGYCGSCEQRDDLTDMTQEAKQVINCVWEMKGRYGLTKVTDTLRGSAAAEIMAIGARGFRTYGVLKELSRPAVLSLLNQMLSEGYLVRTQDEYGLIRIGNIEKLRQEDTHVYARLPKTALSRKEAARRERRSHAPAEKADPALFEALRHLRYRIASEKGMPPYIIFSDKTLTDMSARKPLSKEDMLRVTGVGEVKFEHYGEVFLAGIREFLDKNPNSGQNEQPHERNAAPEKEIDKKPFDRAAYNKEHNRPEGAGRQWSAYEDGQLDNEYLSGIPIPQIAASHCRTISGIAARLLKHGLISRNGTPLIAQSFDPASVPSGSHLRVNQVRLDDAIKDSIRHSFIAFDVETTGLDPASDRIVELGAVFFRDGQPQSSFSRLVDPGMDIPPETTAINHITNAMLRAAPPEEAVYPELIRFLGEALHGRILMCAHNGKFDFAFLANTFTRLGLPGTLIRYADTLALARQYLPGLPNYRQGTVEKYFGLSNRDAHRASADAEICGQILLGILEHTG